MEQQNEQQKKSNGWENRNVEYILVLEDGRHKLWKIDHITRRYTLIDDRLVRNEDGIFEHAVTHRQCIIEGVDLNDATILENIPTYKDMDYPEGIREFIEDRKRMKTVLDADDAIKDLSDTDIKELQHDFRISVQETVDSMNNRYYDSMAGEYGWIGLPTKVTGKISHPIEKSDNPNQDMISVYLKNEHGEYIGDAKVYGWKTTFQQKQQEQKTLGNWENRSRIEYFLVGEGKVSTYTLWKVEHMSGQITLINDKLYLDCDSVFKDPITYQQCLIKGVDLNDATILDHIPEYSDNSDRHGVSKFISDRRNMKTVLDADNVIKDLSNTDIRELQHDFRISVQEAIDAKNNKHYEGIFRAWEWVGLPNKVTGKISHPIEKSDNPNQDMILIHLENEKEEYLTDVKVYGWKISSRD